VAALSGRSVDDSFALASVQAWAQVVRVVPRDMEPGMPLHAYLQLKVCVHVHV